MLYIWIFSTKIIESYNFMKFIVNIYLCDNNIILIKRFIKKILN